MINKILIIGTGFYSLGDKDNYGLAFSSLIYWLKKNNINSYNVDFAVNDINKKKITSLNKNKNKILKYFNFYSVKVNFISIEKLNKLNYDCAFLIIPEKYHFNTIIPLIKRRIPIFSVKPFLFDKKELDKIISLKKKYKSKIFIDYHKRFDKANKLLKQKITKDNSRSYQIIVNYSQKNIMPKKFKKWISTSNSFQYLAPHYLDLIYNWFKPKIKSIYSVATKGYLKNININSFDSISVVIKLLTKQNKEIVLNINTNWIEKENYHQKSRQNIEIIGDTIHLYSDQADRGISVNDIMFEQQNNYFTFYNDQTLSGYGFESFEAFLDYVYFKKDNIDLTSVEENLFCTTIIDEVRKQI